MSDVNYHVTSSPTGLPLNDLDNRTTSSATAAGRPVSGQPVAGQPIAGRPVVGQPIAGRSVDPLKDQIDEAAGNPDSMSINPTKRQNVNPNKPVVKPPFIDVPMGRFLLYLMLGLAALSSFYIWRVTVWASEVGGYWNLMTGRRDPPGADVADLVADAASSGANKFVSTTTNRATTASGVRQKDSKGKNAKSKDSKAKVKEPEPVKEVTVESLVLQLADKLGVKPVELNAVIRPLIDPSAPQIPVNGAAAAAASPPAPESTEPGLLDVLGEVVLD